jgi:hypothetical protein
LIHSYRIYALQLQSEPGCQNHSFNVIVLSSIQSHSDPVFTALLHGFAFITSNSITTHYIQHVIITTPLLIAFHHHSALAGILAINPHASSALICISAYRFLSGIAAILHPLYRHLVEQIEVTDVIAWFVSRTYSRH